MKPKKLYSNYSAFQHVIIDTRAGDTFSLVSVETGTTLIRNAKFLKYAPSNHTGNDIHVDISAKTEESNDSRQKLSMLTKVQNPNDSLNIAQEGCSVLRT